MNQLFADSIRSPAPAPAPNVNPFDLQFKSSNTTAPGSEAASSQQGSPGSDDWLTHRLQSQQRTESDIFYTHGEQQAPPMRRRGHPRLLFMGMRRSVDCYYYSRPVLTCEQQMRQVVHPESCLSEAFTCRHAVPRRYSEDRVCLDAVCCHDQQLSIARQTNEKEDLSSTLKAQRSHHISRYYHLTMITHRSLPTSAQ